MHKILQELKARRKELGITQTEMATRLKISQPQYQKLESTGNPSLKTLDSMTMALNMKLQLVPQEKTAAINEIIRPESTSKTQTLFDKYEVRDE